VLAFLSQAHVEPDITMEIFFVDRPLDGFGAVEVIRPEFGGTPASAPETPSASVAEASAASTAKP
jgi:hypothetical protein